MSIPWLDQTTPGLCKQHFGRSLPCPAQSEYGLVVVETMEQHVHYKPQNHRENRHKRY